MLKQHGIYDIIYNISKQTIKGYGAKWDLLDLLI